MSGFVHWNEDEKRLLFVLTGQMPLQADSDKAYNSSAPLERYSDGWTTIVEKIIDSFVSVREGLPPDVAEGFIESMGIFTGAGGGIDHLGNFRRGVNDLADGVIEQSRVIMESQWQQWAEVIQLLIELAFIAALAPFTGGLSLSETAMAKARTKLALMIILYRLLNNAHLLPAFSEAVQEAFTTFAVRLAMIGLNEGNRRPDGIDWKDIGKSAAFGALAGLFSGLFTDIFVGFFKPFFKSDFRDDNWFKPFLYGTGEVLGEGLGEATAEMFINGLYEGDWQWKPETFAGGVVSSLSEMFLGGIVGIGALWLHQNYFKPPLNPGPHNINHLPPFRGGNGAGDTPVFRNDPTGFGGGDTVIDPAPLTVGPPDFADLDPFASGPGGNGHVPPVFTPLPRP